MIVFPSGTTASCQSRLASLQSTVFSHLLPHKLTPYTGGGSRENMLQRIMAEYDVVEKETRLASLVCMRQFWLKIDSPSVHVNGWACTYAFFNILVHEGTVWPSEGSA